MMTCVSPRLADLPVYSLYSKANWPYIVFVACIAKVHEDYLSAMNDIAVSGEPRVVGVKQANLGLTVNHLDVPSCRE